MDRRQRYGSPIKNQNFKIDVKFDITELDLMCSYIVSENKNIHRGNIINIRNLFHAMNMDAYDNDQERLSRIDFILKGIDGRLNHNLTNKNMLLSHIAGGMGGIRSTDFVELNNNEVEWVNKTISETLKYSIIYNDVDNGLALLTKFKAMDYINRGPIVKEIEEWINAMQVKFRRAKADTTEDIIFSLQNDIFIDAMSETYRQLASPSNKLQFGTQALNDLTGGGVQAGRVYTILGLPGEGKSSTLLDMAIQLKRYNCNYVCADPTKKPCVVLLVMENGVKESVERLFNMCVGSSMLNYTLEDAIDILKNQGNLKMNDVDPIDIIIKFKPNLSVDTSYLYTLVEDLEDEGYETICVLQDYMKRIRPVEGMFGGDTRQQLGAVVNEFKTFATLKNIPVITASQLNRTATSSIDEARIRNKADLVRLIGRSNVGESNLILENSDWICLIAPEYDKDNRKYLGVQRVKSRYYINNDIYTCYIPYINNSIKFVEDIMAPNPTYRTTMRDPIELNAINSGNGTVGKIIEFNDVKLKSDDENNMFANASAFAMSRITIPYQNYVMKEMCTIVSS